MLISTHEIFVRFAEQCAHTHSHSHSHFHIYMYISLNVAKPGEKENERDGITHAKRKIPKQKRKTSSHSYRSIYNLPFLLLICNQRHCFYLTNNGFADEPTEMVWLIPLFLVRSHTLQSHRRGDAQPKDTHVSLHSICFSLYLSHSLYLSLDLTLLHTHTHKRLFPFILFVFLIRGNEYRFTISFGDSQSFTVWDFIKKAYNDLRYC